ncbi:MAG: Uma2 family endonuclease [Candidatus Melainabacteria bacterium]|nr:Uma2 family endonuclease [Candidatus Melainabacteria bacterium]
MQKPHKRMSEEEFLQLEASSDIRHEYVNGEVFAMTRPTLAHQHIVANILTVLRSQLSGGSCRSYADVLVRIEAANSFYSPDVSVVCNSCDRSSLYIQGPSIIFEVLSPSSAATDRREKLVAYKQIPSLNAYVIVHQSRKHVAVYRQLDKDEWTLEELGFKGDLTLEACPGRSIKLSLDEIYEDAEIDDTPDLRVRELQEIYTW